MKYNIYKAFSLTLILEVVGFYLIIQAVQLFHFVIKSKYYECIFSSIHAMKNIDAYDGPSSVDCKNLFDRGITVGQFLGQRGRWALMALLISIIIVFLLNRKRPLHYCLSILVSLILIGLLFLRILLNIEILSDLNSISYTLTSELKYSCMLSGIIFMILGTILIGLGLRSTRHYH